MKQLGVFQSPIPKRELIMRKRMTCPRIVLVGVMAMLACFARGAEPLKIGMVSNLTGPAAEEGRYKIQGAKLAAEEVNKAGGVLGRPIELVIEDSQSTNPGTVLVFSKLAGDKDIPGFIGPIFSAFSFLFAMQLSV
jgi:branched-chain amino acid transport system substrate-binding protein